MSTKKGKIFVPDTNIPMNDPLFIFQFGEGNHIHIPIDVLHELDSHKLGNDQRNIFVRKFHRLLEEMSQGGGSTKDQKIFNGGIDLRYENYYVKDARIAVKQYPFHEKMLENRLDPAKPDHQIINVAYCTQIAYPDYEVILISEDFNVLVTARAVGLNAQRSEYQEVPIESLGYKGFKPFSADELSFLMKSKVDQSSLLNFAKDNNLVNNQLITILDNENMFFHYFKNKEGVVSMNKVRDKKSLSGITPRNLGQRLLSYLLSTDIPVLTISGPAGTGKTLLALCAAIDSGSDNILVSRREFGADAENQGFLPGGGLEKSAPFMKPFFDNLKYIKEARNTSKSLKNTVLASDDELLQVMSLAYLRGRTLPDSFIIIDETQNLSPLMVKTILTRVGEGTRIIFCGDLGQVDDPYLRRSLNGLAYLINNLAGHELFAHIELSDVERSDVARMGSLLP